MFHIFPSPFLGCAVKGFPPCPRISLAATIPAMLDAPTLCAQGFPYRRSNMKALKLAAVAAALFAASSAANAGATFDSVDRKRVVWGKSVSVGVDIGGRRNNKKKTNNN